MDRSVRERGQIIPLFAIALGTLLVVIALAIDGSYTWVKRREAQNAADFSAAAGARIVYQHLKNPLVATWNDAAVASEMTRVAGLNGATITGWGTANGPTYTDGNGIPLGGSYVGGGSIPGAARGVTSASLKTWRPFLAGILGAGNWTAPAVATARVGGTSTGGNAPCAICIIGGTQGQFENASLTANGGSILMNTGTLQSQNSTATANGGGIVGHCGTWPSGLTANPPRVNQSPACPIPDPLAFLPNPPTAQGSIPSGSCSGGTCNPGWYSNNLSFVGNTANLNPGVYYINGSNIDWSGRTVQCVNFGTNCTVGANQGVTVVFTNANLQFQSQNVTMRIKAPAPGAGSAVNVTSWPHSWPGLALYVNRQANQFQYQGTNDDITGTIYIALNGQAQWQSTGTLASMIVILGTQQYQVQNGGFTANYSAAQNVQFPSYTVPALVR